LAAREDVRDGECLCDLAQHRVDKSTSMH
jgi:hypothetical protein